MGEGEGDGGVGADGSMSSSTSKSKTGGPSKGALPLIRAVRLSIALLSSSSSINLEAAAAPLEKNNPILSIKEGVELSEPVVRPGDGGGSDAEDLITTSP